MIWKRAHIQDRVITECEFVRSNPVSLCTEPVEEPDEINQVYYSNCLRLVI
ncbi:MAG: hypothetical protein PVJ86_08935 [Phycisphaerales bacterium]